MKLGVLAALDQRIGLRYTQTSRGYPRAVNNLAGRPCR
jgi:hypothetical protein